MNNDLSLGELAASARPVDVKGMCTVDPSDEFDGYWRSLCDVCAVDYDSLPLIMTTVDRRMVPSGVEYTIAGNRSPSLAH